VGVQEWIEVFGTQTPDKDDLDAMKRLICDTIMEMGAPEVKYLLDFLVYDMHLMGQES